MSRLVHILVALIFTGCSHNRQQPDTHSLADTNNVKKETTSKSGSIEAKQDDYKILPVDESHSNPDLVSFIHKLKEIVSNKDTVELSKSLDTSIIVSHGGGIYGINAFYKTWKLEHQPDKSKLWSILERLLSMGGTWENDDDEGKYFCIPYTQSNKAFSQYKYDFDWYFTAVCISPNTVVYKEPETTSTVLATLHYAIVEIDPEFMKPDFTKISTLDKKNQGYVKTSSLIYSADEYLVIKKIDGIWKITAFAPFD